MIWFIFSFLKFPLLSAFLTHVSTILITIVTFAFYTLINNGVDFNAGNVFSALALFNQLTVPLFIFPITIPIIISAIISSSRIHKFLSQNEMEKEFVGVRNMARILSKSDTSFDLCDENRKLLTDNNGHSSINGKPTVKQLEQIIDDGDNGESCENLGQEKVGKLDKTCLTTDETLDLPMNKNKIKLKKQHQLSTKTRIERNRLRTKSITSTCSTLDKFVMSEEEVVCIRDSQFAWNANANGDNKNILKIDSLSIPKGEVSCVSFISHLIFIAFFRLIFW
jgi:ABC-type multidrug transport system fused ATPase/permease subunit